LDGFLTNRVRDIAALVGLILAVIQTILAFIQFRQGRATIQNDIHSPRKTIAAEITYAIAFVAATLVLNAATMSVLYLLGLPGRSVGNSVDTSYWYLLVIPGSALQAVVMYALFDSFAETIGIKTAVQRIAFAVFADCTISIYFLITVSVLRSIHQRWFDLFIMTQTTAWWMAACLIPFDALNRREAQK
jgi:hypothetical protein